MMTTTPYIEGIETTFSEGMISPGAKVSVFKLTPAASSGVEWNLERYTAQGYVSGLDRDFKVEFKPITALINIPQTPNSIPLSAAVIHEIMLQERSIFVIELPSRGEPSDIDDWRFWKKGIVFSNEPDSFSYNITAQVKNQGKTLIITVDNVRGMFSNSANINNEPETVEYNVDFRFVAANLNNAGGGELFPTVYYSQDPRIVIIRPTNP